MPRRSRVITFLEPPTGQLIGRIDQGTDGDLSCHTRGTSSVGARCRIRATPGCFRGLGLGGLIEYSADPMRRAATERMFEIIGEAMVRLREADPATFARVPESHTIIGFRNRLIHGYDLVDHEVVWSIIRDSVPQLLRAVDALLQEPESAQG